MEGHLAGFYVGVAQTDCNGTSVHEQKTVDNSMAAWAERLGSCRICTAAGTAAKATAVRRRRLLTGSAHLQNFRAEKLLAPDDIRRWKAAEAASMQRLPAADTDCVCH